MKSIDDTLSVVEYSMGLEGNKPEKPESAPPVNSGDQDYQQL